MRAKHLNARQSHLPLAARAAFTTFFVATAFPVFAQVELEDDDNRAMEEMIITTQKREQSVVDVPINVTAYSGQFLETIGVSEFDELSDFTPGLIVQEQSPNNPGFVIRGITSDDGSSQIAPRVTIYENGFDVSRSRGSQFELFDLERTEVIKGPQATLLGTSSLIGAISVITKKPEPGFSAGVESAYGNFNFVKARGFVNFGNDILAGRVAVSYRRRDGFVENIAGEPGSQTPDGPDIADLNGLEIFAIRPSIRFTPNEDLTVDFVFNYQQEDPPGTSFKSSIFPPTGGDTDPNTFAELAGIPGSVEIFGDELGLDRQRFTANLTVNYDIDENWSFTSISGYLNFDSVEIFDADGFAAPFLEFAEDATGEIISQEFRATYTNDRLTAFAGVNWYHEEGQQSVPFATDEGVFAACFPDLTPDLPCLGPDGSIGSILPPDTSLIYTANFLTDTANQDTVSFFADVSYQVTEKLELTGGVRYTYEDRESGNSTDFPASPLGIASAVFDTFITNTGGLELNDEEDFSSVVGRFNALYNLTEDVNVFLSIGRGRRSPVVDVIAGFDPASGEFFVVGDPETDPNFVAGGEDNIIAPEIVWNYEIGAKGSFFNNRMNGSISVFFQDYSDFQTTLLNIDGLGVPITAGDSTNLGVEIEFMVNATENLTVFGNYAFVEGEIDGEGDLDGAPFRLQADHTAAAGILYDRPIFERFRVFGTLTANFRSEVFFEEATRVISGVSISQGSVTEVDLRAGFGAADNSWEISGFTTNLNNQAFAIDGGNTGGAFEIPTFIAGAPRFFGIEVKARY
ncbi:MAG: TonB-dependent receptor [Pseudomonadota bacterium]